jgi:hypothetical protein
VLIQEDVETTPTCDETCAVKKKLAVGAIWSLWVNPERYITDLTNWVPGNTASINTVTAGNTASINTVTAGNTASINTVTAGNTASINTVTAGNTASINTVTAGNTASINTVTAGNTASINTVTAGNTASINTVTAGNTVFDKFIKDKSSALTSFNGIKNDVAIPYTIDQAEVNIKKGYCNNGNN